MTRAHIGYLFTVHIHDDSLKSFTSMKVANLYFTARLFFNQAKSTAKEQAIRVS